MDIQLKSKLRSKTTSSAAQVPAQLPTDDEGLTKSFNSSTGEKPFMDSLPFSKVQCQQILHLIQVGMKNMTTSSTAHLA